MAPKTISVTDEVYELLSQFKLPNESFGVAIKRLWLEKSASSLYIWVQSQNLWNDMTSDEKKYWDANLKRKKEEFTINEEKEEENI